MHLYSPSIQFNSKFNSKCIYWQDKRSLNIIMHTKNTSCRHVNKDRIPTGIIYPQNTIIKLFEENIQKNQCKQL